MSELQNISLSHYLIPTARMSIPSLQNRTNVVSSVLLRFLNILAVRVISRGSKLPARIIGGRHDSVTASVSTLVPQILLLCPHWSLRYCYCVHIGLSLIATVYTLVSHLLLLCPLWSQRSCYSVYIGLLVTTIVSTLVS